MELPLGASSVPPVAPSSPSLAPSAPLVASSAPGPSVGGEAFVARSEPETLLYRPRRRRRLWPLALVAVTLLGGGAALVLGGYLDRGLSGVSPQATTVATPAPPSSFEVSLRVQPASARVEFDGKEVGAGRFATQLPVDGATHVVRLTAPGFEPMALTFRDAPPPAEVELVPTPAERAIEPPARAELPPSTPHAPARILPGTRVPGPLPTTVKAPPAPTPSPARSDPSTAATTWPSAPRTDNRDPWSK
jgi:hypothetical protein